MIRILLVFLIVQTSCAVAQRAESSVAKVKESIINQDKLALLDAYIDDHIDKGIIPGGTFYITHKGKVIYDKAKGYSDIEKGIAYKRNDIFRLASMTKALTSVAIMQLYEQGLLGLDDPVSKYIPEFKNMTILKDYNDESDTYSTIPAEQEMTIRHLLTHTSGLYYGSFVDGIYKKAYEKAGIDQLGIYTPDLTTLDMARLIAKAPLMHEPGQKFTYGLSMDVLGAVVEVITKKKLSLIFLTEIFYPLGMINSHFYLPEAKYQMLIPLYTYNAEGKLIHTSDQGSNYPIFLNKGHYAGGGGLSSTAVDYGRFLQALLNKGEYKGKRIIKESTLDLMLSDQMADLNKTGMGMSQNAGQSFCLGSALVTEANEHTAPHSKGTYSWGGYFNTKWWVDPEKELVFVGLTNVLPFSKDEFWEDMYDIIYSSMED